MPRDAAHGVRAALRQAALALAAAALATGVLARGAAAEEYRLGPGDVVEISVAGLPDMTTRAPVQIDGSLSLPVVGVVDAAGSTLSETRDRIQTAIASRLLRIYLPDGSETMRTVDRDQVSASVVEYRPVFVSGDVAQPGQMPFRPGMTVRQVIAAAGGLAPAAPLAPGYDPIALRAEYGAAWHAAAAASARVWRLRNQLGEDVAFGRDAWPPPPGPGDTLDDLLRVETEIAETRASNNAHESRFLEQQVTQINGQIAVLQRQLTAESKGEEEDAEALATALKASEKGIYTQARLHDIRSAALISSTRRLQTEVNLMQLERRLKEVARELERQGEDGRLDRLAELQEARIVEGRERARLLGASEKLSAAGLALPSASGGAGVPEVTIIRSADAGPRSATFESEIEPGDVIEVKRRMEAASPSLGSSARDAQPVRTAAGLR